MARFARLVVPGIPHHITQRGNRQAAIFAQPEDRDVYLAWLREYAARYEMQIWAYCLMTNHIHLLAVGAKDDSLANAIGRTHMRYARWFNRQNSWRGHLWADRFYSTPLDEAHLWSAVKYIELNPVRAGLATRAEDYLWSSARCHAAHADDNLLALGRPFPGDIPNWSTWLAEGLELGAVQRLRRNTRTGRPTGSPAFVDELETKLARVLRPQKRGRKSQDNLEPGRQLTLA